MDSKTLYLRLKFSVFADVRFLTVPWEGAKQKEREVSKENCTCVCTVCPERLTQIAITNMSIRFLTDAL